VALWDHLVDNPVLPLTSLKLAPGDLSDFSTLAGREYLKESLERRFGVKKYFPFPFKMQERSGSRGLFTALFPDDETDDTPSRLDVTTAMTRELEKKLRSQMANFFRVPDLINLPEPAAWFDGLESKAAQAQFSATSGEIAMGYLDFMSALHTPDLHEMFVAKSRASVSPQEMMSVYLYMIDRALTFLPWYRLSDYMHSLIVVASDDLRLSQTESFSTFAFRTEISPFAMYTPDIVKQSIRVDEAFEEAYDQLQPEGTIRDTCRKIFLKGNRD
jgi:hypothetical protein